MAKTWTVPDGSTLNLNWTLNTDTFEARYARSAFAVIDGSVFTVASVVTAPELNTYALLLSGLGMMGTVVRRRESMRICYSIYSSLGSKHLGHSPL